MLVIRRQQMEAFSQAALEAFETEMVVHCNDFSPQLCKVISEEQLRAAIRQAIDRARGYGFTNRGPVRLYIEMMLLFGSDFDNDPQYPWAGEILRSNESDLQMKCAEQLHEKTLDYLEKVIGPEDKFTCQALKRISALSKQQPALSEQQMPFTQEGFISVMLRETAYIYPEKAAYVGDDALESLIWEGIDKAADYGMVTDHSKGLIYVLMFAFGHGCTDDPLYPWIAQTLRDEKITDSTARAMRLEKKATTWLDHVIALLDERMQT